jgi:hypothetical protein
MSKKAGRKAGSKNYSNELVLNIVCAILPTSSDQWEEVARRYNFVAEGAVPRTGQDIKRHFIEKLCNRMKKPTGCC